MGTTAYVKGGRLLLNSGKLLVNKSNFVLINTASTFPAQVSNSIASVVRFTFSEPTTLVLRRGNSTEVTYTTTPSLDGLSHIVQFFSQNSSSTPIPDGAIGRYNYSSALTRYISFEFDRSILIGLNMTNILLPVQALTLPFSDYPNLENLYFDYLQTTTGATEGSITGLKLEGISNSMITSLTLTRCINSTSQLYTVLPVEVTQMPLITFAISANYQNNSTSNAPLVANMASTLKTLSWNVPVSNAQDLPSSWSALTGLTLFRIFNITQSWNTLTTLPSGINYFTGLRNLLFSDNIGNSVITGVGSVNLLNFPNLVSLNIDFNIRTFTSYTFLSNLRGVTKSISFKGQNNVSRMTLMINALYDVTINNASMIGIDTDPYRALRLYLESHTNSVAVIPRGTYQAPTGYVQGVSNGTPVSDLEKLYVLSNQYGWTITYRTV